MAYIISGLFIVIGAGLILVSFPTNQAVALILSIMGLVMFISSE